VEGVVSKSEWVLVGSLLAILASLVLIAKVSAYRAQALITPFEKTKGEEILVTVQGAVLEPVRLTMSPGSRICDLKEKVSLTADADRTFFRRKKRLQDGVIIEVPKKTVE
jgi:DNA uptake protein ComE-like DNA-binding protein